MEVRGDCDSKSRWVVSRISYGLILRIFYFLDFRSCRAFDTKRMGGNCAQVGKPGNQGNRHVRRRPTHSRHSTRSQTKKNACKRVWGAVAPLFHRVTKPGRRIGSDGGRVSCGLISCNLEIRNEVLGKTSATILASHPRNCPETGRIRLNPPNRTVKFSLIVASAFMWLRLLIGS